jgi:hypothetical protein
MGLLVLKPYPFKVPSGYKIYPGPNGGLWPRINANGEFIGGNDVLIQETRPLDDGRIGSVSAHDNPQKTEIEIAKLCEQMDRQRVEIDAGRIKFTDSICLLESDF